MRKYIAAAKIALLNTINTKESVFVFSLNSLLGIVAMLSIWFSSNRDIIGGYTKNELLTYYFVQFFTDQLVGWYPFWGVRYEIMEGMLSNFLLKPISYVKYKFSEEVGYRLIKMLMHNILVVALYFVLGDMLIKNFNFAVLSKILLISIFGMLINYFMNMAMGYMTFFTEDSRFFADVNWAMLSFLGGRIVPLSFLPAGIASVLKYNPYAYSGYLMNEVYLGRIDSFQLFKFSVAGIFWVLLSYIIAELLWRKGIKKYSGFGQ